MPELIAAAIAIVLAQAALRVWGIVLFLARLHLPSVTAEGRVTLVLPLTGRAPGLEALFAALAAQSLVPARLLVTVEAADDPAVARATALAPLLPCPLEIVIAGRCDTRGQKNTNLIAALARLLPEDQAVVFFDADIRPQPWWLSALATPLLRGEADLVTGYRWPLLSEAGAAGAFWAALDRGFALIPKPESLGFAWGGSLALSPAALARMDVARLLDRTLTEDLVIGGAAAALGLRVLHRRALLLPTPADGTARDLLAFARRQFQLVRLYCPGWWMLSAAAMAVSLLAWTVLAGKAWSGSVAALLVLCIGMAAGLLRWVAHRRIATIIGAPPDPPAAALVQAALAALPPLVEIFGALLFLASARPRRVRWRHIAYAVAGPAEVRVIARASPVESRR